VPSASSVVFSTRARPEGRCRRSRYSRRAPST